VRNPLTHPKPKANTPTQAQRDPQPRIFSSPSKTKASPQLRCHHHYHLPPRTTDQATPWGLALDHQTRRSARWNCWRPAAPASPPDLGHRRPRGRGHHTPFTRLAPSVVHIHHHLIRPNPGTYQLRQVILGRPVLASLTRRPLWLTWTPLAALPKQMHPRAVKASVKRDMDKRTR
jgi:hypothetical protein